MFRILHHTISLALLLLGVRAAFWLPLPRNNSTRIDALNMLGCLHNHGYDNNTIVLRDDQTGGLAVYNNYTKIDVDKYQAAIMPCFNAYAYDLKFTAFKYTNMPSDVTSFGYLPDVLKTQDLGFNPTRQGISNGPSTGSDLMARASIMTISKGGYESTASYEMYMSANNDNRCVNYNWSHNVSDLFQDGHQKNHRSHKVSNSKMNRISIINVWSHH